MRAFVDKQASSEVGFQALFLISAVTPMYSSHPENPLPASENVEHLSDDLGIEPDSGELWSDNGQLPDLSITRQIYALRGHTLTAPKARSSLSSQTLMSDSQKNRNMPSGPRATLRDCPGSQTKTIQASMPSRTCAIRLHSGFFCSR